MEISPTAWQVIFTISAIPAPESLYVRTLPGKWSLTGPGIKAR